MNAAVGTATSPEIPAPASTPTSIPVGPGQPDQHDATVVVLGSANLDIVFTVDRIPQPGETLLAESADRYAGGKGLNQAVAAARAGASTVFIGALGHDEDGAVLSEVLTAAGINQDLLRRSDRPTGQAFIVVDSAAENTIVVASGANGTVAELTAPDKIAIAAASVLLMQLELPMAVVVQAAEYARSVGTTVILNAAPAQQLPPALLCHLDFLVVNEHEVCLIGGSPDRESASVSAAALSVQVIGAVPSVPARAAIDQLLAK